MAGSKVLILGYGEMGHAMQSLLGSHHELQIWDKFPAAGLPQVALAAVAAEAEFVIFCLPVMPHREIALEIAPLLRKNCICFSIAKGLDASGQTAAQIFAEVFASRQLGYALLYGPMISEELRVGRYGFAQLACSAPVLCPPLQQLFAASALRIRTSSDVIGISWAVILKNVYAMVFGMADELGLGDNLRGFLMVAALGELDRIVKRLGGEAGSAYDLAGLGDLVTTATSEDSHHHALGRKLARGDRSELGGEGVHTLQMVDKHDLFPWRDYALFALVHAIVLGAEDAASTIDAYLREL